MAAQNACPVTSSRKIAWMSERSWYALTGPELGVASKMPFAKMKIPRTCAMRPSESRAGTPLIRTSIVYPGCARDSLTRSARLHCLVGGAAGQGMHARSAAAIDGTQLPMGLPLGIAHADAEQRCQSYASSSPA